MYRTPPRYGIELSEISRDIMQIATFLHMAFGFYMFSNSQIFTISSSNLSFASSLASTVDLNQVGSNAYLSAARITQPHVIIYLVVLMIILGLYIITRLISTFFPNFWSKLFCCVKCLATQIETLSGEKYKIDEDKAYSNNIYREMIIDDLKLEYNKTKNEGDDYRAVIETGVIKKEIKAVEYMLHRYEIKKRTIKEMINRWLRQAYISEVLDTNDAFDKLFKVRKSDPSHRLKTLYSYDIKDNTFFKKTQKVEDKIRKAYGQ